MWHQRFNAADVPEFVAGKSYTNHELELMGELLLRQDARREMCRECKNPTFGKETGQYRIVEQVDKDGAPILTEEGEQLRLKFPEYICSNNHKWFKGEGKAKGTKGENSFLLDEHLIQRKRREIHSATGEIDPSIVSGVYWRSHPNGRPTNSEKDRKERGLGWYR